MSFRTSTLSIRTNFCFFPRSPVKQKRRKKTKHLKRKRSRHESNESVNWITTDMHQTYRVRAKFKFNLVPMRFLMTRNCLFQKCSLNLLFSSRHLRCARRIAKIFGFVRAFFVEFTRLDWIRLQTIFNWNLFFLGRIKHSLSQTEKKTGIVSSCLTVTNNGK